MKYLIKYWHMQQMNLKSFLFFAFFNTALFDDIANQSVWYLGKQNLNSKIID